MNHLGRIVHSSIGRFFRHNGNFVIPPSETVDVLVCRSTRRSGRNLRLLTISFIVARNFCAIVIKERNLVKVCRILCNDSRNPCKDRFRRYFLIRLVIKPAIEMIAHRNVLGRRQCLEHARCFRSLHINFATIDKRDEIDGFCYHGKQGVKRHILDDDLVVLEHVLVTIGPANKHFARSRIRGVRSVYIALVTRIMIINLHLIIKDNSVNRQIRFIGKHWVIIVTCERTRICRIATKGVEFPGEFIGLHVFGRKGEGLCQSSCVVTRNIGKARYSLVEIRTDNRSRIISDNATYANIFCSCGHGALNRSIEIGSLYNTICIKIRRNTTCKNSCRFGVRCFCCF